MCYRREYARFTADPPAGAGYPPLEVSPYLGGIIDCFLATDGAVVCRFGPDTDIDWMQTDQLARTDQIEPPTNVGAMTIGPPDLDPAIADGVLPPPVESARLTDPVHDFDIRVARYDASLSDLLPRLLASNWNTATDPARSHFWMPFIARGVLFRSVSGMVRYFDYLEILGHSDDAAWDQRSAAIRAHVDIRRDFTAAAAHPTGTGTLSASALPAVRAAFGDVLGRLEDAILGFESLLRDHPYSVEEAFHRYLIDHPILLDAYATATSKPRFDYPEAQQHTDKSYVEPDVLLTAPGNRYRLVELERPDHALLRKDGGSRAGVTHAAFQTAEWQHYIAYYPGQLRERFPGMVADRCSYTIVIGRRAEGPEFAASHDVMARQFAAEMLSYDDVLDRAKAMLDRLRALAFATPLADTPFPEASGAADPR